MLPAILEALNPRKNKLLLFAQMAMSQSQFIAFRALLLDELGQRGLERDLVRILAERTPGTGMARAGIDHAKKEVRHE